MVVAAVFIALVLLLVVLMLSGFGRDVTTKTDDQLYTRFNRYLKHRGLYTVGTDGWMKADAELKATGQEIANRGYDIEKLFAEETNAVWENRPMDFSRCKNTK